MTRKISRFHGLSALSNTLSTPAAQTFES